MTQCKSQTLDLATEQQQMKNKSVLKVTKLKKKRINMSDWMDEPMSEWDYRVFHFKHECSLGIVWAQFTYIILNNET